MIRRKLEVSSDFMYYHVRNPINFCCISVSRAGGTQRLWLGRGVRLRLQHSFFLYVPRIMTYLKSAPRHECLHPLVAPLVDGGAAVGKFEDRDERAKCNLGVCNYPLPVFCTGCCHC